MPYPKRLIEVDLPIKQISAHARREKSIRHGHISTLHIWWARRPLAACRAVICAALWPDPADENCPQAFRDAAAVILCAFAEKVRTDKHLGGELCASHFDRWRRTTSGSMKGSNANCWPDMRYALLDFIADFANWDASTVPAFLETARALTQAAHEALGGAPGTRPLVVDPFAGGGSIPLEALRVGADAFASDLNPVAVLLNKVVLEYIPRYGQKLADEVRKWGKWIKEQAEKELAEFYPKDPDGATPIAYLWARTITCEGPGCGAEVPLMRSLWLAKKGERSVALRLLPDKQAKRVGFEIIERKNGGWVCRADPNAKVTNPSFGGTVRHGSATCPVCGYTIPNDHIRSQLADRRGGADDARLVAVVTLKAGHQGRLYRLPDARDLETIKRAAAELDKISTNKSGGLTWVPDEAIPSERPSPNARGLSAASRLGMQQFRDLFAPRQLLLLTRLSCLLRTNSDKLDDATGVLLALAVGRQADQHTSFVTWLPDIEAVSHTFTRQALQIAWDYVEPNPFSESGGSWEGATEWIAKVCEANTASHSFPATVQQCSATAHLLPTDVASAVITDPPYYDSVPYADLSDFFYVWLHRCLVTLTPEIFTSPLTPKDEEAIWNPSRIYGPTGMPKDISFYERQMQASFSEARRITLADGIGVVVFAHKSTAGWEAVLSALLEAGWIATASWPIDTERSNRVNAIGTASLASSIHIVCRPRENPDGSIRSDTIGDWRDVLAELPKRIHDWMPRLAAEGVVGADAIFACLGPALEIFSRYARVEKASGEQVTLKEYLEYVWAAVSKEALALIFEDADASGFEEDARLTAMWLWTLAAGVRDQGSGVRDQDPESEDVEEESDDEGTNKKALVGGYVLEYDAARKISQGLGAHLERLGNLIEVKGDKARLLPVAERARYLFGKDEGQTPTRRREQVKQLSLLEAIGESEETAAGSALGTQHSELTLGKTTLDQVHQSMLLFAAGRGDGLKNYLLQTGVGRDQRFWRLAQALSALYPASSDEKRWVDGVLARKKGLGL